MILEIKSIAFCVNELVEHQGKWNNVYYLSVSKNNCLTAAQNRCQVNREPANISVASSACDIDQT